MNLPFKVQSPFFFFSVFFLFSLLSHFLFSILFTLPYMQACPIDFRRTLYGNVQLAGGTMALRNLRTRLQFTVQVGINCSSLSRRV